MVSNSFEKKKNHIQLWVNKERGYTKNQSIVLLGCLYMYSEQSVFIISNSFKFTQKQNENLWMNVVLLFLILEIR